jgi:hypothetical protein
MAVQMHVAFSKTIKGAAVFAGGPYDCAQGQEMTAVTTCMSAEPSPPNPQTSILTTDLRGAAGTIDPPSNLADSRVYMYSGTLDSTVNPKVMASLYAYYSNYLPSDAINFENAVPSAHTQPTDDPINSNPCWLSSSPFISDCNYDGAGAAFQQIFGADNLNPRNNGTLSGKFVEFDQNALCPGGNAKAISLDNNGFAFVPADCQNGQSCKVT